MSSGKHKKIRYLLDSIHQIEQPKPITIKVNQIPDVRVYAPEPKNNDFLYPGGFTHQDIDSLKW